MAAREYGQYCGVTQALELVGERWALLIVRDLLVGPRRYGELANGLQRISKALLAAEIDIHYCYALITSEKISGSIVVHVDNPASAAMVLGEENFRILDESDLR